MYTEEITGPLSPRACARGKVIGSGRLSVRTKKTRDLNIQVLLPVLSCTELSKTAKKMLSFFSQALTGHVCCPRTRWLSPIDPTYYYSRYCVCSNYASTGNSKMQYYLKLIKHAGYVL